MKKWKLNKRKWNTPNEKLPLPTYISEDDIIPSDYEGPMEYCSWCIPNHLMMGAYPVDPEFIPVDSEYDEQILKSIIDCGITTFVCLVGEYTPNLDNDINIEHGRRIHPYHKDILKITPNKIEIVHHNIKDMNITTDEKLLEISKDICKRLHNGEVIYVHCLGGNGRTGSVIATVLGLLYGLTASKSLELTQILHDCRAVKMDVLSPQTYMQRDQIIRILKKI